jgi:hypothetical protein
MREGRGELTRRKGTRRGGLGAVDARELRSKQSDDTLDILVSKNGAEKRGALFHLGGNGSHGGEEGLHALRIVARVHKNHGLGTQDVEATRRGTCHHGIKELLGI